jgi:DNA-directed RNA polymerase specialized sigma24 family protein
MPVMRSGYTVGAVEGSTAPTAQWQRLGGFEALYRDAGPKLWRAIYGFSGGRRDVADDAVAEAFARAIERSASIREPLAWIYRTAFRIASDELRRERRPEPRPADPVDGVDVAEMTDVLRSLATLSPNQRAAVLLHDVEGFTSAEVGR